MIQEIAEGIFVQEGSYFQEQRSLVCGKDWCILIDAPQHFNEAEELKALAEEKTPYGVRLAVLTHGHLDHTATLQVFPGCCVAANAAAREYMLTRGQIELEKLRKIDEELQRIRLVLPTITLSHEEVLYTDTGRSLRCIPAPGHSMDSQVVLLEPDMILFTGDSLSPIVPPYFPDGSLHLLLETLILLGHYHPRTFVPGHGSFLHGEAFDYERLRAIAYLDNLEKLVKAGLEKGQSVEQLQHEITWQSCTSKPAPPEEYLKYHVENIAKVVGELSS